MSKRVFVTVGSTCFDELVSEVTKSEVLKVLYSKGFQFLTIQIGKGTIIPKEGDNFGIKVEFFRYKEGLDEDFKKADLIISHAGAGSCIEALEANKPLIAVINHSLMNNHQKELAEALAKEGFCKWCYTNTLYETLKEFEVNSLSAYKPGNPQLIVDYIESLFEFKVQ